MSDLFDYIRLSESAAKLIYRYGDECEISWTEQTPAPLPYNPPTVTTRSLTTRAVFARYKQNEIDGSLITRADQKVLIAANVDLSAVKTNATIVRKVGTTVENWPIKDIEKLRPGPVLMLFKVQVRR